MRVLPTSIFWLTFVIVLACMVSGHAQSAEPEDVVSDDVKSEVARLLDKLRSENTADKMEAIRELGLLESPQAEEAFVYTVCFESVGPVGQVAKEALRHREGLKTATSDWAAGIDMPEEVKALAIDLGSSYPVVRVWAARRLGKLGPRAAAAVPLLLDALEDKEYECPDDLASSVRSVAMWALEGIGTPAVEPALARLDNANPVKRAHAAKILGSLEDRRAFKPLLAALNDEDKKVRRAAISALAYFKDPASIKPLLAQLDKPACRDRDAEKVAQSLTALGPSGVEPLIGLLSHEKNFVREYAASSLAHHPDPRSIDPLLNALHDEWHFVQGHAAQAFHWIRKERGPEPVIAAFGMKDAYHEVRRVALHALKGHPREVEFLIEGLSDREREVRGIAATRLKELRAPAALDALVVTLKDAYFMVRGDAVEALGELGDRRAVEPLIAVLRDKTSRVRGRAARALGQIGDARAVEPLLELLVDPNTGIRSDALQGLSKFKRPDVVEALIKVLKEDEDNYVRQYAAEALGEQGNPRAIEPLREALDDKHDNVRGAAQRALKKIGG